MLFRVVCFIYLSTHYPEQGHNLIRSHNLALLANVLHREWHLMGTVFIWYNADTLCDMLTREM